MKKFKNSFLNPANLINNHCFLFAGILSFILNFLNEFLERFSIIDTLSYIVKSPFYFLFGCVLIYLTYLLGMFIKKRTFSFSLITILWLGIGITNSYLFFYRHSPFICADFMILKSALNILHLYIPIYLIVLIIIGILGIITLLTLVCIKEKSKKIKYKKLISMLLLLSVFSCFMFSNISYKKQNDKLSNLTDETERYGFTYCFMASFFSKGITKPDVYSKASILSIKDKINAPNNKIDVLPNIIVVQSESFIDPCRISGIEYSKDPIPNFRNLKDNFASGLMNVKVYGGGTANTEFEVLSGMNLEYFGIGEYPYESVLCKKTLESIPFNLKEYGYKTHAMHNHTGTFYDRNIVYSNLGFDIFTSAEYMNNMTVNKLGWGKSDVFNDLIINSMKKSKEPDFYYIVTSECHGKYPKDVTAFENINLTSKNEELKDIISAIGYYTNEVYDEDKWFASLIETLSQINEPTILVIYGDHLPALDNPEKLNIIDNIYNTEYVIWNNYGLKIEDKNLHSYSLLPYVLKNIGINSGYITKFNQYSLENNTKNYEQKLLEYDIAFGNKFIYDNGFPYKKTDMQMGEDKIVINSIENLGDYSIVHGKNFTKYSVVMVGKKKLATTFVDSSSLRVETKDIINKTDIAVAQIADNGTILSKTEAFLQK